MHGAGALESSSLSTCMGIAISTFDTPVWILIINAVNLMRRALYFALTLVLYPTFHCLCTSL